MCRKGDNMKSDNYLITSSTLMLKYINNKKTKIYEANKEFIVSENMSEIIFNSCQFYGSSYNGRLYFSKSILNLKIKVPIIIEDYRNIIFFPTRSIDNKDCIWISYNHLEKITKENDSTIVFFDNNKRYKIDISSDIINRQFYNCLKLEKLLESRLRKV